MKKISIFALLMLTTAAQAECIQWGRDLYGNRVCMMSDLVNRNPITPETAWSTSPGRVIPSPGEPLISNSAPKCDDGWSLVDAGRPMCARELREPK